MQRFPERHVKQSVSSPRTTPRSRATGESGRANLPHANAATESASTSSVRPSAATPLSFPCRFLWLAAWRHPTCPLPPRLGEESPDPFLLWVLLESNKPKTPPRLPSLATPPGKRAEAAPHRGSSRRHGTRAPPGGLLTFSAPSTAPAPLLLLPLRNGDALGRGRRVPRPSASRRRAWAWARAGRRSGAPAPAPARGAQAVRRGAEQGGSRADAAPAATRAAGAPARARLPRAAVRARG